MSHVSRGSSWRLSGLSFITRMLVAVTATYFSGPCNAFAVALRDGELSEPQGGIDPAFGKVLFVNGVANSADDAMRYARAASDRLHVGVRVVYNDLTMDGIRAIDQGIALTIEKLGDADVSVNPATATLMEQITTTAEAGQELWLLGHSAGCLSIQNAVLSVDARWRKQKPNERDRFVQQVHVVYVGGASFADDHDLGDGTPIGVSRFDISDVRDGVAQFAGVGEWGDDEDAAHAFEGRYVRNLDVRQFNQTGSLLIDGGVVLAETIVDGPDPADRVARIRVRDLRESEESRRSVNVHLPWPGHALRWSIAGHPASNRIHFTVMEDCTLWSDNSVSSDIRQGTVAPVSADSDDDVYIGRVELIDGAIGDDFWAAGSGFWVEARPVP